MFAAIWDHRYPVFGILLVVASSSLLFADFPGDWKYLQMALFISVWTLGASCFGELLARIRRRRSTLRRRLTTASSHFSP